MKKSKWKIFMFLLLLIAGSKETFAQTTETKGSLFIIGGGSRPASLVERIIKEAKLDKGGYAIVLPMASAEPDSSFYYAKQQFAAFGLNNIYKQIYKPLEVNSKPKLDSLKNARLIYIPGGDQDRFMKAIAGSPAAEALLMAYNSGAMIAGTSAGAAVMSEKMITGTELKHPEYHSTFRNLEVENLELKEGLGLLKNVIIDQHFVKRSRYNRLLTAVIENPQIKGIGIDESTAILVKNGIAEVVGTSQVIVFSNPTRAKSSSKGKLAAKGIVIDIYLNNDKFVL